VPHFIRADQVRRRPQNRASARVFAILAAVIQLFYILVVLEIALGLYSLWEGYEWMRAAGRRLASHAGFYAPQVALICPCKGSESGLEENLTALAQFDYASYEIYFSLATSLDPAVKVIERVKAASQHPVHIVVAGPPEACAEKVHNLKRAVEAVPEQFEVFVFVDSDVRLPRNWLGKLVAPLQDPRIGAATAYRWILPSGRLGAGGFASAMASAWNAAVATMLGRPRDNFCWGGGTAIRRKNFDDARVAESWSGAVSDDFALTRALEASGRSIVFCPECMAPTLHPWTGASLLEFTNRQIVVTRVYSPRRWALGAAAHLGYSLTLIYAAIVVMIAFVSGDPWIQLFLMAMVIPLLAAAKGAMRTIAIGELLPTWRAKLNEWSWVWTLLAPVVPFLFAWNFLSSLLTKRIRWRNIRYELVSPGVTQILKR
jgi:ceramide glucosyltransferase